MAESEIPNSPDKGGDGAEQGQALCTECGLCCMGVIHRRAKLDADEIPAARSLGLPVIEGEHPGFALPCPRLEGTLCAIYGHRPRVCGRYECQLLQDLKSGHRTLDTARSLVASAKDLLGAMRESIPANMSDLPDNDLSLRALSELKLRRTALELFLDKYFRNSRDRRSLELNPLDDSAKV